MRKATLDKTFTNLPTAESWLRWNGFTRYVGMWTWQKEDGSATATLCDVESTRLTIVFHDEEI